MTDTERVTRGDLPHWYKPGHAHFITYRLANSIPQVRLREWRIERQQRLEMSNSAAIDCSQHRQRAHKAFFARYDEYLDRHAEIRWLQRPAIAKIIRENLYHHHRSLYELIAWCIMPNHVHVVLQPLEAGISVAASAEIVHGDGAFHSDEVLDSRGVLSGIMHSLKSYTANQANRILRRDGRFWQSESYDHWVRDHEELGRIIDYVCLNPVSAGLSEQPHRWRFSSAFDRFERDRSLCGCISTLRDDWRQ